MNEFTVAQDSLPFDFFEEIGFSFEELAIQCINAKFITLSHSECEIIYENNFDVLSDKIYELKDSDAINDNCIGEEEVDESSGTWGYFHYRVDDIEKTRMKLEEEAKELLEELVNDLEV